MALKHIYLDTTVDIMVIYQQVEGCADCKEAYDVNQSVAVSSTDLGCSSNYSSENLDDRSG